MILLTDKHRRRLISLLNDEIINVNHYQWAPPGCLTSANQRQPRGEWRRDLSLLPGNRSNAAVI